jgi:hypothetical protein
MQNSFKINASPVAGKTFSLFGTEDSAEGYYRQIAGLADACLEQQPDMTVLIDEVRRLGSRPRLSKKLSQRDGNSLGHFIVRTSHSLLDPYTTAVQDHLRELSLLKRWDRVLSFTEEQYHLAMLEIELMNRAFGPAFRKAGRRLAFLPHCLRDLDAHCRAAVTEIDHACRGCSPRCFVNSISTLLRQHRIEPYIWMQANLKRMFRKLRHTEGGLGVMGIACVPELVRGMRMCVKLGIPVIGVPLNANRCARWMEELHPTSVELEQVRRLVKGEE